MSSTKPLDADALLEAARAETGLDDFGDDSLPERVARAVEAIREAGVPESEQPAARPVFQRLLVARLRFTDDRKRYPIAEESDRAAAHRHR